jgi:hypothetical protein
MSTNPVNLYDFRPTGDNSDTGMILAAVAELNSNANAPNVVFPRGDLDLEEQVVFTGKNILIDGNGCRLISPTAEFFKFGSDETICGNVRIENFQLHCPNTLADVDQNVFAADFHHAVHCKVNNIRATGLAGGIKIGSDSHHASRCYAIGWRGDFNNGLNSDANILVMGGASCKIREWVISGSRPGGSTNGAILKFAPPYNTNGIDTFEWQIQMQFFDSAASAFGKPYGVHVDRRFAPVTNQYFQPGCVFDHTSVCAFYFQADTNQAILGRTFSRNYIIEKCRFSTESGRGIYIDNASESVIQTMQFDNCLIVIGTNDYGVEFDLPGNLSDVTLSNCHILDKRQLSGQGAIIPKQRAVVMNGNGWTCYNNKVRGTSATHDWVKGFDFTGNGTEHGNTVQSAYEDNPTTPNWTIP